MLQICVDKNQRFLNYRCDSTFCLHCALSLCWYFQSIKLTSQGEIWILPNTNLLVPKGSKPICEFAASNSGFSVYSHRKKLKNYELRWTHILRSGHSMQLDVKRNRAFTKWVANDVLTVHAKLMFWLLIKLLQNILFCSWLRMLENGNKLHDSGAKKLLYSAALALGRSNV